MPIYDVQAPDGKIYSVEAAEGTPQDQIFAFVKQQMGQAEPAPQEGIGAAFVGGAKRMGSELETALESIISPEKAAQRGLERQQQLAAQYAPGASLEKVKQAYEERGLFPAVGEAISQIPSALAEQAPNIATSLGGARLGAMAGSAIAPGVGTVVGGLLGAGASALPSLYAQNLQRQAEEQAPEISRAGALGAAVPGAALEVASEFIPLGRGMIGKLLGPQAEAFLKKGTSEAIENRAKESLFKSVTKGGLTGAAAEIPTEVAQQMLERYQAGLSLTDDDALKEYGEAAYGAGLVGGPFGVAARTLGRSGAREEFKQLETQREQERIAQEEAAAALLPPKPETFDFPGGYQAVAEEIGQTEEPEGYQIFAEGQDAPLTTVGTPDEVQPKIERLNAIREQEAQKALDDIQRINDDITSARDAVETLEAVGQTQTPEYMQATENLRVQEEQATEQVQQLMDKVQTLKAPLTMQPMAPITKVQKQYVLTKDGQAIGAFASPQQAEAVVAQAVGPEIYEKQVATKQAATELTKVLQPMLKQFGLKDVNLNIAESLQGGAGGSYLNKLITVALDEPNPVQTMRHESVHALRDLGFITPQQWSVLSDRATKEWMGKYLEGQETEIDGEKMTRLEGYRKMGLSNDAILEEAIADAFGDFDRTGKAPPGMIASVFKRIKSFFDALRNSLKGAGFQTAEDIFGKIERGELKPQVTEAVKPTQAAPTEVLAEMPAAVPAAEAAKLSLKAPETPEFKKWFGNSQIKDEAGKPMVLYHGTTKDIEEFKISDKAHRAGMPDGFYFTTDPEEASTYAGTAEGANVMPAFVQMENPFVQGSKVNAAMLGQFEKELRADNPGLGDDWINGKLNIFKEKAASGNKLFPEIFPSISFPTDAMTRVLTAGGYDGFKDGRHWVAVRPEQIKSATGNIGTYSPETGEIKYSLGKAKKISSVEDVINDGIERLLASAQKHRLNSLNERYDVGLARADTALSKIEDGILKRLADVGVSTERSAEGNKATDDILFNKILPAVRAQLKKETKFDIKKSKPTSDVGHKREATTGRYVGAPDWVGGSPQQLVVLRKKLLRLAKEGEAGRYWYENSSKAILELAGGDKKEAERIVALIAIYSPNATVPANTSMALNAYYQYKAGQPIKAGLPEGNQKAEDLLRHNKEWSGIKTNSFYQNLMVEIDSSKLDPGVATMDMWMALAFDYGMKALDQGPKYKFAEREIQNIADQLGWDAHQVQAAIWTSMKGRIDPIRDKLKAEELKNGIGEKYTKDGKELFRVKPDRRYDHFRLAHKMGMAYDLQQADIIASKYDFSNAIYERTAQMSWEATPGASTKILPGLLNAPIKEKFEYLEAITKVLTNENGQDKIAVKIGLPSGKTVLGFSAWQGDIGAGAQTFTGVALQGVKDKRDVTPEARNLLNLYCAIKGYVLAQEAVVWHIPSYDGSIKNQNGIQAKFNRGLNSEEMSELYKGLHDKFGTWDIAPAYLPDGFRVLNFTDIPNKTFHKGVEEVLQDLPPDFGDGNIDLAYYRSIGDYISNDWSQAPYGEQYAEQIESGNSKTGGAQRPDIQEWATNLRSDVEAVNEKFSKKYNWGKAKLSLKSERPLSRPSTGGGVVLSPVKQENAVSFVGVHYGNAKVDTLSGDKYGTGIRGAERRRLDDGWDDRIRRRIYFYVPKEDGSMPIPEAGLGQYVYSQQFDNILGPGPAMSKLFTQARGDSNEFESAVVDAGYDGYAVPSMGMMVVLNHNAPVNYVGTRAEMAEGKAKLSLKTSFPSAKAAVEATKDLKAPDTREFKLFQGGSQLLNKDGSPKLMFHGSKNIFFEFKENAPIFVADNADDAEYFSRAFKGQSKLQDQIYPLWVRAETPFDFANTGHVDAVIQKVGDPSIHDKVLAGDWRVIEKPEVQKALKELGFDSFYVNEERDDTGAMTKNLAVFKATQVKSATGNFGDFSEKKDIRFSLPQVSAAANAAVGRVTTAREEKGWAERLLGALAPEMFSTYRQAAINRYNRLGEADKLLAEKMGGEALLARNSAEAAALMSDNHSGVVASVMGVGDRRGGVPVIKNGITMVDHSKKGVAAIFAPLAKYGDPKVYQYFQFYSAVKRGARLFSEGRERLIQPADVKYAQELAAKFPEFESIRKDWVAFNDALVEYQKQAGVLSDEAARQFTMYSDYIPFYRQMDGEQTIGPRIYQSISGVKTPKALKGGEAPLADFLETVVRNTHAAIGAGMKNLAAQRAVKVGKQVQIVHEINPGSKVSALDTITVLEKGEQVRYQCNDQLFIDAVKSLNMPDMPFLGILAAPANLLRNLVTRDPGFVMANLLRDSLSSYVTSGTNATPIAGTVINFGKALKGTSASFEALMDAGIIGGYEFSANVEQSGATLSKDLAKKSGKGKTLLTPFTSVWDGLEKATTASDAATRMAIYERVMQETGDEVEALYRAQEVMNFNRKGSSAVVRILTAAVPFLNARIQGLDVFYRASTGNMNTKDAKEIQRKFFVRGMTMMGLSMMYYFAVAGNPDYEDQEQETKDNNWIIPGVGRIPIPFEVGTLFKTVPERIAAYYFGTDTGEDFRKAMWRAANSFVPLSPAAYIPQTMKPILEAMTNYSFFTQREIVGMGLKDVDPKFQVGPGTTALAQWIGKLGLSPLKTDHIIKGYTGTMGMYAVDVLDTLMDQFGDSPKPAKRFEQMPIIKRFALDPEARGSITSYYELKHTVDTTVRTMNLLERSSKPEEYAKYLQENMGVLAIKGYVQNLEGSMKKYREMRRLVLNSNMSSEDKRDTLVTIGRAEINLTQNIQQVKRAISELK